MKVKQSKKNPRKEIKSRPPKKQEPDDMSDELSSDEVDNHKASLKKLKSIDPEFYNFLEENDKKLLEFNLSDNDNSSEEGEDDNACHKPSTELEKDSDESDFEGDEPTKDNVVTLKQLKQWSIDLQNDKSKETITCLIKAFHAALQRVSTEDVGPIQYKVDGSSVFNGIIQICVLELGPAIRRFLGITSNTQNLHKLKKFSRIKTLLKGYFLDLLKILSSVTSSNILVVLLKHLHYMASLLVSFPNINKPIIKKLILLWGTSDERVRVVAFLCILRITHGSQAMLLDTVLKNMHMTYVQNCKFVSVSSLPGINFMRRSLVEMYGLDLNTAYQHVFLFIRQLGIQLRNAIIANKRENIQAVYNWQFINSLKLWGNLLASTYHKPQLQPLLYPFVQICFGTIKLAPTAEFYPLRFHVSQILIDLSKETDVFINTLPFLLEVLVNYDFNKKHQNVSMKPLQFNCILRLSKSQLSENGFKDALIENIYGQLLEYLAAKSHTIAFPDLALPSIIQLKQFLKKCKNSNYNSKMKQILEKIEQNCNFVENARKNISFSINETKKMETLETKIKNEGTPLFAYYNTWNEFRNKKKKKQIANNEEIGDYKLPSLKKLKRKHTEDEDGEVELFPSDEESDDEVNIIKANKRGKRGGKKTKQPAQDHTIMDLNDEKDVVADLDVDEW